MSHRFTSWWRALSVVLLSLATLTWPSASWAASTPRFDIVHQNAITSLSSTGTSTFTTVVSLTPAHSSAKASVAIFPALLTRGQIAPIISGAGVTGRPLSATGDFSLDCLRNGVATFGVTLFTTQPLGAQRSCDGISPRLHLDCSGTACGGVYPLRYTLDVDGTKLTKWSLLAVQSASVARRLNVDFIATLASGALKDPAKSREALDTIGSFSSLPLTLSVNYEALARIDLGDTTPAWRSALDRVLASSTHQAIASAPKDVDFAGLAENHLATQVTEQFTLSSELLTTLTRHYADVPVVINGAQSSASLLALDHAGFNEVVLPEGDLDLAPSSTLTWGAPFHVAGAGDVTALAVDGPLSTLVTDSSIEPGRRAALTLATLAFLHYEEPYAPAPRTVVIEAPVNELSKTFLNDFLGGMGDDAFSQLTPLSPSFDTGLIGTNGAPATRVLATTGRSTWSSHNVSSLLALIGAVNSYAQGVRTGNVPTELRVAVATTEMKGTSAQRQAKIDAANALLNAQLAQFSIDQSSITLAGPGNAVPITVISHLHYTVDAVIHLVTNDMTFPKGGVIPITMNSPTESIRVPATDPRGGSLILQVLLTTPNDQVVLARTAIQVRVAGTSVVGYVLTFASLFVLGLWWWRTIRRRPKARHAR